MYMNKHNVISVKKFNNDYINYEEKSNKAL